MKWWESELDSRSGSSPPTIAKCDFEGYYDSGVFMLGSDYACDHPGVASLLVQESNLQ